MTSPLNHSTPYIWEKFANRCLKLRLARNLRPDLGWASGLQQTQIKCHAQGVVTAVLRVHVFVCPCTEVYMCVVVSVCTGLYGLCLHMCTHVYTHGSGKATCASDHTYTRVRMHGLVDRACHCLCVHTGGPGGAAPCPQARWVPAVTPEDLKEYCLLFN